MREDPIIPLSEQQRTTARKVLLEKFKAVNDPFERPRIFRHKIHGKRFRPWHESETIWELLEPLFTLKRTPPFSLAILVIEEHGATPICIHLGEAKTDTYANLRLLGDGTDILDLGQVKTESSIEYVTQYPSLLRQFAAGFKMPKSEAVLRRYRSIEMRLRFNDGTPDVRRQLRPEEISALCDAIALQALFDQESIPG